MGRKSIKDNKTIYQISREEAGLTREKASELMVGISPERIEKLENGKVQMQPYDVKQMAECYHVPGLCNYYCANECAIAPDHAPELKARDLAQIAVETLNGVNTLYKERDRLLEIVEDGEITEGEQSDFEHIKSVLDKLARSVDSLRLWVEEHEQA